MKVHLDISPEFSEDRVRVEVRELTPAVSELVTYIQRFEDKAQTLTVRKGEEVYLLNFGDICRVFMEDKVLQVETAKDVYQSSLRLYQVKNLLPGNFQQISQSELVNLQQLDHLKLTPNGLVKVVLKNGSVTYSSRRYLKLIKERLEL